MELESDILLGEEEFDIKGIFHAPVIKKNEVLMDVYFQGSLSTLEEGLGTEEEFAFLLSGLIFFPKHFIFHIYFFYRRAFFLSLYISFTFISNIIYEHFLKYISLLKLQLSQVQNN